MEDEEEFIDTRKELSIKQRMFLEVLETEARGRVTVASNITGIHRSTYYHWIKNDKFKMEIKWIEQGIQDDLFGELFKKVLKGSEKAIFYLLDNYGGPEWK